MRVEPVQVEEVARELYIRALKILPPDVKEGFQRLAAGETDATARRVLDTMITNIRIAEGGESRELPVFVYETGPGPETHAPPHVTDKSR